jgi:ion channel-forming bestrophin family protein
MIKYDTKNWVGVILRVHGTVVPRIFGRTLAVALVGVAAVILHEELTLPVPISASVHAMVGAALGLLLVFRTNASYDRFWEGRKLIGGMVNNCRDLARQTSAYLRASPPSVRDDARRYIVAWFTSVRHYLREEHRAAELETLLTAEERAELQRVAAPPLLIACWLTRLFEHETASGRLSEHKLKLADEAIGELIDFWGGAERILRTPVPFAYAHHIKGFLTIFCFTSPLALLDALGWYTPLAAAVVAYGLFGIDEIGVEIEDPFGLDPNDLPLDAIGATIERDVGAALVQPIAAPAVGPADLPIERAPAQSEMV